MIYMILLSRIEDLKDECVRYIKAKDSKILMESLLMIITHILMKLMLTISMNIWNIENIKLLL